VKLHIYHRGEIIRQHSIGSIVFKFILSIVGTVAISVIAGTWIFLLNVETVKREQQLICKAQTAIDNTYPCNKRCKIARAQEARQQYIDYLYTAGEWSE